MSPTTFPVLVNDRAMLPVFFVDIHTPITSLRTVGNREYAREAGIPKP